MSLYEECMAIVEGTQYTGESEISPIMEGFFKKKDKTTPASRKEAYKKAVKAANEWISKNRSRHNGAFSTKFPDAEWKADVDEQYEKFISMDEKHVEIYHYDAWKHSKSARSKEASVEFGKLSDELDKYIQDAVGDDFKVVGLGDWDGGSVGLAVHTFRY